MRWWKRRSPIWPRRCAVSHRRKYPPAGLPGSSDDSAPRHIRSVMAVPFPPLNRILWPVSIVSSDPFSFRRLTTRLLIRNTRARSMRQSNPCAPRRCGRRLRVRVQSLTRPKISDRWRGRVSLQVECGSHREWERGTACGSLHRLVRWLASLTSTQDHNLLVSRMPAPSKLCRTRSTVHGRDQTQQATT